MDLSFAATSPDSPGAGFPWNEVSSVLEGLVKPSAETQLLQDHTPVTPSSYYEGICTVVTLDVSCCGKTNAERQEPWLWLPACSSWSHLNHFQVVLVTEAAT